jgi:flagellar hook-basal body complex protein FliE
MNSINTTQALNAGVQPLRELGQPLQISTHGEAGAQPAEDFAQIFKTLLAGVDQSQQRANRLSEAFDAGEEQDLAGVMIAQQKARLSFQTTLQVRNKVVSAYQDIMNMPI